jgi:hypothetical protein
MKSPQQPKRGRAVMWLLIAASFSIVLGTVMLSNDMRNLKALAHRFGIELVPKRTPAPPPPAQKPHPRPEPVKISIAPRLLDAPQTELAGDFLRTWRISGPAMCAALRGIGIETTEWSATAFNSDTYECSFERVYKRDKERITSSLFLLVRGDGKGTITSMRVKMVGPPTDAAGQLDPAIMRVFDTMLTQPHWLDFHDTLAAIRSLRDVKEEGFGATITFTQEPFNPGSFNFILSLRDAPGAQRRTKQYFSHRNWLASPDPSAALPPPE